MSERKRWDLRKYVEISIGPDRARFGFDDCEAPDQVAHALLDCLIAQHGNLAWREVAGVIASIVIGELEDRQPNYYPPGDESLRLKWFALRKAAIEFANEHQAFLTRRYKSLDP